MSDGGSFGAAGMFELKKIGIVKRASAWLLDAILLAVLATGIMWVASLICRYGEEEKLANEYYALYEDYQKTYLKDVANHFGYTYEENDRGYTITKNGAPKTINDVLDELRKSGGEDEAVREAYQKFLGLPSYATVNAQYKYVYSLLFMMVSVGILLSYLILEFIVPVFLKNGQTVGKKVFGICLVRPDCVRIRTVSLFARTVIGKFAIETMFPVLMVFMFLFGGLGILAIILLAALLILDLVLLFATKNRTPIHDLFAGTVAVDMKTQMIFDSEEELNEKKALLQKESVEQSKEQ